MSEELSPITYRTPTGFGEATNDAILAAMSVFRRFCTSPQDYLHRILGPSKLLELPNELLLQIALSFDNVERNRDLRHLALTCRRIRYVAQEALIRTAVITPDIVRGYLGVLFEHPQHLAKVRRLQLNERRLSWYEGSPAQAEPAVCRNFYQYCHMIIQDACEPQYQLDWIGDLCSNVFDSRAAYLAILIILLPNLQTISFTDLFVFNSVLFKRLYRRYPIPHPHRSTPNWHKSAFDIIASKIHTLDFADTKDRVRKLSVQFRSFSNLKHLSVDDVYIMSLKGVPRPTRLHGDVEIPDPTELLPNSLESLKVTVGGSEQDRRYMLEWIEEIHSSQRSFPSLRLIQLMFKSTLELFRRDVATWHKTPFPQRSSYVLSDPKGQVALFKKLQVSEISLETFFARTKEHSHGRVCVILGDNLQVNENGSFLFHRVSYLEALHVSDAEAREYEEHRKRAGLIWHFGCNIDLAFEFTFTCSSR